jgi:hypothetical protein
VHHLETRVCCIWWKCGNSFANWNLYPFFRPFTVFEHPIKGFVHKNFNDLCGDALEKDGKAAKETFLGWFARWLALQC